MKLSFCSLSECENSITFKLWTVFKLSSTKFIIFSFSYINNTSYAHTYYQDDLPQKERLKTKKQKYDFLMETKSNNDVAQDTEK